MDTYSSGEELVIKVIVVDNWMGVGLTFVILTACWNWSHVLEAKFVNYEFLWMVDKKTIYNYEATGAMDRGGA